MTVTGAVKLRDPFVETRQIVCGPVSCDAIIGASVEVHNTLMNESVAGNLVVTLREPRKRRRIFETKGKFLLPPRSRMRVYLEELSIDDAQLWFPHTHLPRRDTGVAARPDLYDAEFAFTQGLEEEISTHTLRFRVGLRNVTSVLDPGLGGRVFYVNGRRIFLQGGNWITTDQFLRFAANRARYYDEVRMHRDMGFNLIRVWGGGLTERPEFYEACDELGVFVMQEFWMTGDNNGRWAGSYQWPLDHSLYLSCAKDAILMLRNHPSLLFWCGTCVNAKMPNISRSRVSRVLRGQELTH